MYQWSIVDPNIEYYDFLINNKHVAILRVYNPTNDRDLTIRRAMTAGLVEYTNTF